jgi:hypothetical protein
VREETLVAIVVGLGVPVATFVFTYLTNRQNADREAARDERRMGHERRLAHEARVYGRRADAYRDVLRILQRTRIMIEKTMPVLDEGETPPDPPTQEEIEAMLAASAAFASPAIRDRMDAMRKIQNEFFITVSHYRWNKERGEAPGSKEQLELYRKVDEIRKGFRAEHAAIQAEIARELQQLPTE